MEKKKFKFSIIDLIISLAIIAVVVFGVKIINKTEIGSSKIPDVEFVVEVKQKPMEYVESVKVGDDVYDSVKGGYFGKVTDVKYEKASAIAADTQNGKYITSYFDDKYDVYITIHGTPSTYSDKAIMFASKEVRVGEEIFIKSKNYTGRGYAVGLKTIDAYGGADK